MSPSRGAPDPVAKGRRFYHSVRGRHGGRAEVDVTIAHALASRPRRRLHGGRNFTKAVVDLIDAGAGRAPVVVKDFSSRPWLVRRLVGPWHLDREVLAYAALRDLPGIARFVERLSRCAMAVEYIPGRTLAAARRGELPVAFFDGLEALVARMHARGVAHGDLHRHDVLATPSGEPFVVDFSTAVVTAPGDGPWRRFLFRQMCAADRRSVAKLRRRLAAGAPAPLPERPALYRAGAFLKRLLARSPKPRA